MNKQTYQQLIAVILIDALEQARVKGWSESEFKAHLKSRLSKTGQQELAV